MTKVRSLPLAECIINENWEELGLANVIISRQHKSGNYTFGVYLVVGRKSGDAVSSREFFVSYL